MAEAATQDELTNGKLPPVIWRAGARWFPHHVPGSIRWIEVVSGRNGTLKMVTPYRTGVGSYTQYFLEFPEGGCRILEQAQANADR